MPDNKRPQIKLPTIEIPRYGDPQSMISSISQIKEAIELMSGIRGGKSYFPTYADATLVQERLKTLENKSAWDVVYNQEFSGISAFFVRDLGAYRNLRGQLYIRQTSGTLTWPYSRVLDINGNIVSAASSYTTDAMYKGEGGTTVVGFTDADKTVIPWSLLKNLTTNETYGSFNAFEILSFNKTIQTVIFNDFTYWDGIGVYKGNMITRETASAMRTGLVFGLAAAGGPLMSGHLYLEGLKG